MNLKFKLLIVIISVSSFGIGQNIKGKIIESNTNTSIPFASLEINKSYGVITNDSGDFSIDITPFKPTDSLTISCMGYQPNKMILNDFKSQNYQLDVFVNELAEVILTDQELTANDIMVLVKDNLSKNHKTAKSEFKLFSRRTENIKGKKANFEVVKSTGFKKKQLQSFNQDFDALEKKLLTNNTKQYTDLVGILKVMDDDQIKLDVPKAIKLFDKQNDQSFEGILDQGNEIILKHIDKDKTYKVKSGLFTVSDSTSLESDQTKMKKAMNATSNVTNGIFDVINNHNFTKTEPEFEFEFITEFKKYDYELDEITYLGDEMVYVISFYPDTSSAKFSGTLYVSSDTYAILKMEYQYKKGQIGNKLNLKLLMGIKFYEKNKKGFVVFKKDNNGFYYPNHISTQIDQYFFLERPIKFIENKKKRRNQRVSFEFMVEGIYKVKTDMLILSSQELTQTDFDQFEEKESINYLESSSYSPDMWKDYNVIEPLDEMKNFKQ